jgi:hypothetical protein
VRPIAEPGTQERAVLSAVRLSEIIEMPVTADGTFDFGHVPKGSYLLNLFPLLPGLGSLAFEIGDADVTSLEFVKPVLHTVSGRIAAQSGPLPNGLLAFYTNESYVAATINPDLTFSVRVQAGRHQVDVAGMPGGYSLASVRAGSTDVTQGLTVGQQRHIRCGDYRHSSARAATGRRSRRRLRDRAGQTHARRDDGTNLR